VSERRVLGLFAKRPEPGLVKTRLAASTSPAWAAEVASAFLHDTLDSLMRIEARRVLAYAPPNAGDFFAGIVGSRFAVTPQSDGDLGRRMHHFFAAQFAGGADLVVLLGTDSPTLPLEHVQQAFTALEDADVVLGPATDGGYYLVGCAKRVPPIFEGVAWSGPRVLAQTVERLADANLRLALLPPWYDVDTLDDWHMLRGHLAAMRLAGIEPTLRNILRLPDPPVRE
jgi:rSAM/selenodomain-associated transferase 1